MYTEMVNSIRVRQLDFTFLKNLDLIIIVYFFTSVWNVLFPGKLLAWKKFYKPRWRLMT